MNRINVKTAMLMAEAMKRRPLTYDTLAQISGLSKVSVQRWMKAERKNVHVADYQDDIRGRRFVPMFRWGPGNDAPRPGPRRTPAERMADVRARRRMEEN